jgi:hypothetical protein
MLMREAGLENVFKNVDGNWACVNVSDIIAADADVFVVADAAWDTAASKIRWMYDDAEFCELEVLKAARFVQIPFSATTLSPRNGPAVLDLARAALHVRTGAHTTTQESGVGSFSPFYLQSETACLKCPLNMQNVVYDNDENEQPAECTTVTTTLASNDPASNEPTAEPEQGVEDVSKGFQASVGALCATVAATSALLLQVLRE